MAILSQYHHSTTTIEEGNNVRIRVHKQLPDCILVKLHGRGNDIRFCQELDPGIVPIFPRTISDHITKLPKNRTAAVSIRQFPLIPMYACTGHGTQGSTFHHPVVICDTKCKSDRMWLYVAVSRVTKFSDLFFSKRITIEDAKYMKIDERIAAYFQRIQPLVTLTESLYPLRRSNRNRDIQQQ